MNIFSLILALLLSFPPNTTSYTAEGKATYYADRMHGHRTANGDKYDKNKFTAAHNGLPFNTLVQVTNLKNGKSVVVRINDRKAKSRHVIIDLSRAAAEEIGLIRDGITTVRLKEVEKEEKKQQDTTLVVSEAGESSK